MFLGHANAIFIFARRSFQSNILLLKSQLVYFCTTIYLAEVVVVSYRQPVHTTSALLNAYTGGGHDDNDDDDEDKEDKFCTFLDLAGGRLSGCSQYLCTVQCLQ